MAEAVRVHMAERGEQGRHHSLDDRGRREGEGLGRRRRACRLLLPSLHPAVEVPVLGVLEDEEEASALLTDDLGVMGKWLEGEG